MIMRIPLMLLIYFGFTRLFENDLVQLILSVLGGAVLIWLGIHIFRVRNDAVQPGRDLAYNPVAAGVVTSVLNPFYIVWWATVGSVLIMQSKPFGFTGIALFIPVHLLCDLAWLSFVSVLIYRTRALWGSRFQQGLFTVCSLILVGFGVWFLASGLQMRI